MALISCPECSKEISDKAIACPNCGNPMSTSVAVAQQPSELVCPDLSGNLSVGKELDFFLHRYYATFKRSENVMTNLLDGQLPIRLCENGIRLQAQGFFRKPYDIHKSQIISIQQTTQQELIRTPKSVIGRAVVGGLVMGPLGAIIGAMSGIPANEKVKDKVYIVINYWDVQTRMAQTILLLSEIMWAEKLVKDYYTRFK